MGILRIGPKHLLDSASFDMQPSVAPQDSIVVPSGQPEIVLPKAAEDRVPLFIDRVVEVVKYVDRPIETVVERIVEVIKEVPVEVVKEVEVIKEVEKEVVKEVQVQVEVIKHKVQEVTKLVFQEKLPPWASSLLVVETGIILLGILALVLKHL